MVYVLLLLVAALCTPQTVIYSASFARDLHGPRHYYCLFHSLSTQYLNQSLRQIYITEHPM